MPCQIFYLLPHLKFSDAWHKAAAHLRKAASNMASESRAPMACEALANILWVQKQIGVRHFTKQH